ncbi:MAG TPA: hypothetical protein VMW24_05220 [Sedimentisphaerales bacterium]|nr:hypothetical protein [Sedimentisphaerales bacterium]
MATFSFARESFRATPSYAVAISRFENDAEQRRLRTNKIHWRFEIQTPVLTQVQQKAHLDFYVARQGSLEDFGFVNPSDGLTYTVRYNEPPNFDFTKAFWRLNIVLVSCDEDEDA